MSTRLSDTEPTPRITLADAVATLDDFKANHLKRLEAIEIKLDQPTFSRGTLHADEDKKAFESFLRTGNREYLEQAKAMSIGSDASGGYTHVRELGPSIIAAVGELNPLTREVRQVTIDANQFRQIFTTSRTANGRAAESGSRSESNTATFEVSDVTLYDLYSYPKLSNELLNSSQFDLSAWIRNDIAQSFSETLGDEFITGNGSSKSVGLLNATSTGTIGGSPTLPWGSIHSVSNSPNGVSYPSLLETISALPARYRAAGNCKWYMATAAIEAARNLVDQNDLPIWRQDFGIAGAPMVLLGYPVVEVPQLDGQSHTVMFGDARQAYAFVQHSRGLGFIVDQITAPGFTKFYASLQCAGGVMDSRAMVALAG